MAITIKEPAMEQGHAMELKQVPNKNNIKGDLNEKI